MAVQLNHVGTGRARLGVVALGAVLLSAGCAAGQIAATARQQPTCDCVNRSVGDIDLRGMSIETPMTAPSYAAGSTVAVDVVLVNTGTVEDKLTGITSTAIGGWGAYPAPLAHALLTNSGATATSSPAAVGLKLPPGERTRSGPTSDMRIVLTKTKQRIFPAQIVTLRFSFEHAGTIDVPVPVHLTVGGSGGRTIPPPSGPSDVSG